jgi:hypothetical protein
MMGHQSRHPAFCWRHGQAAVIFAVSLTALVGVAALAVDVGLLVLGYRQVQNAADAAALAGAAQHVQLSNGTPAIDQSAASAVALAMLDGQGAACGGSCVEFPACHAAYPNACIRVTARRVVQIGFARVLGFGNQTVASSATALAVRHKPTGEAVISLNGDITTTLIESGGRLRITGSLVAFGRINSAFPVIINEGEAYSSGTIQNAAQFSSALFPNYTAMSRFEDPYQDLSFPDWTPNACSGVAPRIVDDVSTGLNGGNREVITSSDPRVIVKSGGKARFSPGHYCNIQINGGNVEFGNGVYRIDEDLIFDAPLGTPDPPEINGNIAPTSEGLLFAVRREISISGITHYTLKGRRSLDDVLFYIPASISGQIRLVSQIPSSVIGSIYGANSQITIRGNGSYCATQSTCGALVRRGVDPVTGEILTLRGGRVVGRSVNFQINNSTPGNNSWAVEAPPLQNDYVFAPTLIK